MAIKVPKSYDSEGVKQSQIMWSQLTTSGWDGNLSSEARRWTGATGKAEVDDIHKINAEEMPLLT